MTTTTRIPTVELENGAAGSFYVDTRNPYASNREAKGALWCVFHLRSQEPIDEHCVTYAEAEARCLALAQQEVLVAWVIERTLERVRPTMERRLGLSAKGFDSADEIATAIGGGIKHALADAGLIDPAVIG